MSDYLFIQLIAIVVATACVIPGTFLVLRKMAMMTDAITHTTLLGIVIAFFIVYDINSPVLILGAALIGIITVYLVGLINRTRLVSEDSAIGVVFPLLFSLAIIIISRYARNVHLHVNSVLLGELAYAPFNRLVINGVDMGPKSLYTMGAILVMNILLVVLYFKELKLSTFDEGLSAVLGFSPVLIHYGLMTSVSITAVGAFEAVGSILVIAFMIGPPVTAYLLTDDLRRMIFLSVLFGAVNAVGGFQFALWMDVSIAGSMAMMTGVTFFLVFVFAPERGLISVKRRRRLQRLDFAEKNMLFHIYRHENSQREVQENGQQTIRYHLNWKEDFTKRIIARLKNRDFIDSEDQILKLTESGRAYAKLSYKEIIADIRK